MAEFDDCGLRMPEGERRTLRGLAAASSIARIVEVGSFVGEQSLLLAGYALHVFCIDPWAGGGYDPDDWAAKQLYERGGEEIYRIFRRNVREYLYRTIFPLRGTSIVYAEDWPFPVDMVFIDGNHDYLSVGADILGWRPHVRPGGILCGHDYSEVCHLGVKRAVDELLPRAEHEGTIWWVRV